MTNAKSKSSKFLPFPSKALRDSNLGRHLYQAFLICLELCWDPESNSLSASNPISFAKIARDYNVSRSSLHRHILEVCSLGYFILDEVSYALFCIRPGKNCSEVAHQWDAVGQYPTSGPIIIKDNILKEGIINDESLIQGPPVGQRGTISHQRTIDDQAQAQDQDQIIIQDFLRSRGVIRPMLIDLPRMEHVTLEFVRSWFAAGDSLGWKLSYVLAHIRDNAPLPTIQVCPICSGEDGRHFHVSSIQGETIYCPMGDGMSFEAAQKLCGV
jgi:hypothetical protein